MRRGHLRRFDLRESVEDCGTDLEFGYPTVEGAGCNALTEQLEAMQLGLDKAAAVMAAPFLPDRASKPFDRMERFVAGVHARAALLPWPSVAANRNDRLGITAGDRGVKFLVS